MQIKNYNIIRSLERNTLSELFLARHVHENYYVKVRLYDQQSITNEEVREAHPPAASQFLPDAAPQYIATLDYGTEGRYNVPRSRSTWTRARLRIFWRRRIRFLRKSPRSSFRKCFEGCNTRTASAFFTACSTPPGSCFPRAALSK